MVELLISAIRPIYHLDWNGVHGSSHWGRVRNIGSKLSGQTGANPRVVEAFSVLHDSCRLNDHSDPDHGPRAAKFARSINDQILKFGDDELNLLDVACMHHTRGATAGFDITVLTCWDSDRLDLGRVGILPRPEYLCTDTAKSREMIEWAYKNSLDAA